MTIYDGFMKYSEGVSMEDGKELKDIRKAKLICYLIAGHTSKEAADKLGVSLSTVERCRRDENFQSELSKAVTEIYTSSLALAALWAEDAVNVLIEIASDETTPKRVRIEAAKVLLAQAEKGDLIEMSERLKRLESLNKPQKQVFNIG